MRMTSALAPPCSGPLSVPIAADDRRVDVRERRRRHARGERRGVQLVVGVKDQRDVEGPGGEAARPLAGQHVQKIRRVAQHRIGLNRTAAGVQPSERRDDRADLRGQPDRLALVGLRRVVQRRRDRSDRGRR